MYRKSYMWGATRCTGTWRKARSNRSALVINNHHYASIIENYPGVAEKLRTELLRRWDKGHERMKSSNPKAWESQRKNFIRDMDDRPYLLRGENLRKAEALDLPTAYNRLALMCVSVFHLSHWRLDVTAVNYMVQ